MKVLWRTALISQDYVTKLGALSDWGAEDQDRCLRQGGTAEPRLAAGERQVMEPRKMGKGRQALSTRNSVFVVDDDPLHAFHGGH